MQYIQQLDLSRYIPGGEALKTPCNQNKPDKVKLWELGKLRCVSYCFQFTGRMAREQRFNMFCTFFRSKLHVLHSKLASDMHCRNFIKEMLDTTISIFLLIVRYECGDELYQEMRRYFKILIDAIDYLVTHDSVEQVTEIITSEDFHKIVFYLKLLNLMRNIKQRKKFLEHYPHAAIKAIQQSYLYNVIINGPVKHIKYRFAVANQDYAKYGLQFNIQSFNKVVNKQKAAEICWQTLYDLNIAAVIKEGIWDDLKLYL
ncbi:unnamed protein product (macronuclear) [Paramecium tetraurelia]|uniref:Uncharacterized protein n=1 Tax=Paramecium tetraurelia TaxID=5888 RepID=A0BV17_PARTE|nr:uncharacterized protein GSPATT00005630001 [Paramecium tetraurelia]CAK62384.1 unnamed protein product [Paramecium tetraurelia]|eukprot:XP_001429782.1 hypothetical protein (macronuclear) [Paramecium tetraurelia strain d4-2]